MSGQIKLRQDTGPEARCLVLGRMLVSAGVALAAAHSLKDLEEITLKRVHTVFAVLVAAFSFWSADTKADDYRVGEIAVVHPWARATASTAKTGAAFMIIRNGGADADRLVGVSSSVSRKAGLHKSLIEDGIMKMRPADVIDVPAGGMVMLKPGSYHVMFMGLKGPLKEGDSFPLSLVFEKAGEIEVMVTVMKAGAMGSMKMKHAD